MKTNNNKTCGYDEVLPIGQWVIVKGKLGQVVGAQTKKDQCGDPIVIHTIKFIAKYQSSWNSGWRAIKPFESTSNPSFIQKLEKKPCVLTKII